MIPALRAAWSLLANGRHYLTLLALAASAAALYAWGATGRADRARLIAWAEKSCAAAGTGFEPGSSILVDAAGKQQTRSWKRGEMCAQRILGLAEFQRTTNEASTRLLAEAMVEHERKTIADADAARQHAAAARAAAQTMEKANARILQDDRVGGAWFGALNELGGLRAPDR